MKYPYMIWTQLPIQYFIFPCKDACPHSTVKISFHNSLELTHNSVSFIHPIQYNRSNIMPIMTRKYTKSNVRWQVSALSRYVACIYILHTNAKEKLQCFSRTCNRCHISHTIKNDKQRKRRKTLSPVVIY